MKVLPWIISFLSTAAFVVYLLLFPHGGQTHYHTTTVLKYDSGYKVITVPVAGPVRVDTFTVPADVDTAAVLAAYHEKRYYEQTYKDSSITATVTETVHKNSIVERGFTYKITRPTTIITTTITKGDTIARRRFYLGARAGAGPSGVSAGPSIYYIDKKDKLLTFDYDAVKKSYNFGAAIPLFKHK